jgi:hypothetical protein
MLTRVAARCLSWPIACGPQITAEYRRPSVQLDLELAVPVFNWLRINAK